MREIKKEIDNDLLKNIILTGSALDTSRVTMSSKNYQFNLSIDISEN